MTHITAIRCIVTDVCDSCHRTVKPGEVAYINRETGTLACEDCHD